MVDADVMELARQQFGTVSRHQLVDELGWSRSQVSRARSDGRLISMLPSTYRLASHPDTFLARAFAAQLWSSERGFLSSWTAGRLRGLRKMPSEVIHLTVPTSFRRASPEWLHVDRSSWFGGDSDREPIAGGLLVATPLRMLFGLAADFNQFRFDRAAEDAWHLGLITPSEATRYLEAHRCRGKDGVATLERWLDASASQRRPAQSGLEQDVIDALRRVGLPPPVRQHRLTLPNGEVIHLDIAWPVVRLAVEPGSAWFHGGDRGQRRDHDRDLGCSELGWMVVRVDDSFRDDPMAFARRVRRSHRRRHDDLHNSPRSA